MTLGGCTILDARKQLPHFQCNNRKMEMQHHSGDAEVKNRATGREEGKEEGERTDDDDKGDGEEDGRVRER